MADESTSTTASGVLGRLPKWPRKALNNSVIAAEQAYRKRSGLPPLSDADIEALRAGVPMSWEGGDGAPATAAPQVPAAPAAAATPAAAANVAPSAAPSSAPPAAAAGMSPEVQKWLASGKKWSKSAIAAEQARRKRNNLSPLTDEEVTALLGELAAPVAAAATPAAPAATPAPAAARAAAVPAASAGPPPVARTGESTRYVGTPAVGTSKAAAAGGLAAVGPDNSEVNQRRRRLVWSGVAAFLAAWFLAFFRFFLPRTLFEPATSFKIGYPSEYALGVDTKFQQKYRIWVDRTPDRLFVIYARCTHLGCTPDWKPSENKFKCPCHGSGYDSEGINFEGPAPRPMDRAHIEVAPDGQILVDVSKLYSWPKGQPSHFNDPGSYLSA
ncbi:MAG TPA: Rieske 2Fe-2S domain-containing protein [Terriglobales bacterium]|nr:Rieske 2Fe-2S domain-containing protein [Terriglobales bacterium]